MTVTPDLPEELAAAGFQASSTPDVLTARAGSLGRILLNRPRAINALTRDMVNAVRDALETWADDDDVSAITIEGAGERGLCAGGDVRSVRESFLDGDTDEAFGFFEDEYRMNATIADHPKLVVSFQDGIVMGGGVGISAYAGLRVATDRTKVAMPETIIGFFPDVGALYLLSRAPGGIGAYLAATGTTVGGGDACAVGLSDVVVESASWETVLERLAGGADRDEAIAGLAVEAPSSLLDQRTWIDDAFGHGAETHSAREAVVRLRRLADGGSDGAREALGLIDQRSPLSVAATLEALRRAATMGSVHDVLAQDMTLARGLIEHGDFAEGVRAQLVDKDRAPQWSQASVDAVTDDDVARLFDRS